MFIWLTIHCAAVQIFLCMKRLIREKSHHLRGHCENLNGDCTSSISDISKTGTCNQMNALCEHLWSKKAPECVWYIRRDVGQVLRTWETFPCSCYSPLLARGKFLESPRTCSYMFVYLSRSCEHVYGIGLNAWLFSNYRFSSDFQT